MFIVFSAINGLGHYWLYEGAYAFNGLIILATAVLMIGMTVLSQGFVRLTTLYAKKSI